MKKILFVLSLTLFFSFSQNVSAQQKTDSNDRQFYSKSFLQTDFDEVDAALRVTVKTRELADQMGGDCEQNKGGGLCLYLLKGEVTEVYKGAVKKGAFEFYATTDSDYKNKDWLLGDRIVFLKKSDNFPNKKSGFGTMENSTREVKYNVVAAMRKIARARSNKKN